MSFRQLEAKLRLAYVNKERAAQLEERKLAREIGKRDKEVCVLQSFCQILQHDYRHIDLKSYLITWLIRIW